MKDTIAAIATPLGNGGIGIIRISGKKSFEIVKKLFYGKKSFDKIKSHTINFGKIINPKNGNVVDEVLLSKMNAPKTFTREDVIEINSHGGMVVLNEIMELLLNFDIRLAEPGEFTKRAFLNGRIDLSQAEAVIDIINSRSYESKKAAVNQLEGSLSKSIGKIREGLINLLAQIEVKIDYPEYDIEDITRNELKEEILKTLTELENYQKSYKRGKIVKEGIKVAIAGRPNVGKSSLLNELTGKNRAIVTDIPGTTRDTIEEFININGIPIRVTDTAGLRETEDLVEQLGIENSKKTVEESDLLIYMISAQDDVSLDMKILNKFEIKNIIILINKIDLGIKNEILDRMHNYNLVKSSVTEGIGIDILESKIEEIFNTGKLDLNNEVMITNLRHKKLIDSAIESLKNVVEENENMVPVDLISIEITDAADFLGQIIGESVKDDIINNIFSNFCIGK